MKFKSCPVCGCKFRPHPQVPNQTYCSAPECQRERRRRWQREKRRTDPDYQDNQSRSNKEWAKDNPEYWGKYRDDHPEYAEHNRKQQQKRNQKRRAKNIAKMDVSASPIPPLSGRYRLTTMADDGIARMDAWIVEITVLSSSCDDSAHDCKERT